MKIKIFEGDYNKSEFYQIMGKYFAERKYKKEMPYMTNDDNKSWFLFYDKDFFGFCSIIENNNNYNLGSVYVLEGFRNQGYSCKMIQEIIKRYKDKPIRIVTNNCYLIKTLKKNKFEELNKRGTYTTYLRSVE